MTSPYIKISMLSLLAALLTFTACDTKVQSSGGLDSTAVATIAGDKTRLADLMHQAFTRGTFDDALTMAMQDSALAGTVAKVVAADARFAVQKPVATTGQSATSAATHKAASGGTTHASSGDVLDKTEQGVKKANERIDQAARVKDQAAEAKRKIDAILK